MARQALIAIVAVVGALGGCGEPTGPGLGARAIWKVPSGPPPTIDSLPLVPAANADRSVIYFGTPDHRLKKVRGKDGHVLWNVATGGSGSIVAGMNAVLSGEVVAIARVDVIAFDTTTGVTRWTYVAPGMEETGNGRLVANDSTVFAGGRSGRVHAIDSRTGTARWIADISGGQPRVGAFNPVISDDLVFVCSKTFEAIPPMGTLWALDAVTGAAKWSYQFSSASETSGASCYGSAAVWHDLVIQPQEDGRIFAFDRVSGEIRWTTLTSAAGGNDIRWATVSGDIVVVTSLKFGGLVVAYDAATGAERWRRTDFGGSLFLPAVDASAVFVDHGWVFASYDLATGATRWAVPTSFKGPPTVYKGTPIISTDRIYVAGRDGSYALNR